MLHKRFAEKIVGVVYFAEKTGAGIRQRAADLSSGQNAQKMIPLSAERNHCIIIQTGVYWNFCGKLKVFEAVIPHKCKTFHFT